MISACDCQLTIVVLYGDERCVGDVRDDVDDVRGDGGGEKGKRGNEEREGI